MKLPTQLNPEFFFDLSQFSQREIFKFGQPVYAALGNSIQLFLSKTIDLNKNLLRGTVSPQAFLVGTGIVIEEGTTVEAGAYICGPTWIGKNCEIRHGAYIRGNVIVGEGCVIGHTTEVKNSILLNRAKAGHFAFIGDSIVGNDVNLGAGTKLANLRMDRTTIVLRVQGLKIDTQLEKIGAILGDGTQTGCNSVANPGTLLYKGSIIYPCAVASGVHFEKRVFLAPTGGMPFPEAISSSN